MIHYKIHQNYYTFYNLLRKLVIIIREYPLFCTPEEYVNIDIKLGLVQKEERQNKIDELYKAASEILAVMQSTDEFSRR